MIDHFGPWHRNALVVIDFETTDKEPSKARAVEVAAVRFELGTITGRFSSLINPGCPIPKETTDVHGITDEKVKDAPTFSHVFGSVCALAEDAIPVAYNASYDRAVLQHELEQLGMQLELHEGMPLLNPRWPWIDPLVMVRHFDRFVKGKGRHKLSAVCERHKITLEETLFHRATADAEACGLLLMKFMPDLGDVTVSELLRRQAERAHAQEEEFKAYRAKMAGGAA